MNNTQYLDSRYSWKRLGLTLLIATVGNTGMWSIIVIMPAVQAEFGVDRADASLPYTMTMIGFALGNLFIGKVVDRFGIVPALIGAALLTSSGYYLAALGGSLMVLSLVQLAIGFGTAASFGPLIADISHWFSRRRGIAVAIAASGNYLSGAIIPLTLSGLLADSGWQTVYSVLAIVTIVMIVPLAFLLKPKIPQNASADAQSPAMFASRSVNFSPRQLQLMLAAAGIGCCVAMSMPQVHIVALNVDLGYGAAAGAKMLSLMLFGGVISRLASGLIADRLGGILTLLIGSTLQCLALFLYLVFDGLASLYLVSLIFGLSQGGIVPSYAVIVREYLPAREAGVRIGFVIMATIVGMAAGGWMSGWIRDFSGSYQLAFINGIGWNLMNIAIIALILKRTRINRMAVA